MRTNFYKTHTAPLKAFHHKKDVGYGEYSPSCYTIEFFIDQLFIMIRNIWEVHQSQFLSEHIIYSWETGVLSFCACFLHLGIRTNCGKWCLLLHVRFNTQDFFLLWKISNGLCKQIWQRNSTKYRTIEYIINDLPEAVGDINNLLLCLRASNTPSIW